MSDLDVRVATLHRDLGWVHGVGHGVQFGECAGGEGHVDGARDDRWAEWRS